MFGVATKLLRAAVEPDSLQFSLQNHGRSATRYDVAIQVQMLVPVLFRQFEMDRSPSSFDEN